MVMYSPCNLLFTIIVLLVLGANGALGALTLSNALGDNMVLQHDARARIWGWDTGGYKVTVSLDGQNYPTIASDSGLWEVFVGPKPAGGPYNISIEDQMSSQLEITNVLFGDVWVCSGQSNMVFPLSWAFNSTAEIADTVNFPNIRVFMVGNNISFTPLPELSLVQQPWSLPSPSFMSSFSAVCWFHARNLYESLGVPIGLVESCWGGTIIEAWSSPTALAKCPNTTTGGVKQLDVNPNQNSVLWNAMIVPLLPTSIFGVLWYQGEQNTYEPSVYACREIALITDWRANFGTEFVFNFVQLAPWSGNENSNVGTDIPDTRVAQLEALSQPRVGFATAVDLGDSTSPYNDIHPRYKQEVGLRLATTTLAVAFGKNITWQPPQFLKAALVTTSPNISFTIAVDGVGSGLYYVNNSCPSNVDVSNCSNFQIVLSDGNKYDAIGEVSASSVEVVLPNPNKLSPTILYYGYSSWPVLTVFRKDDGYPLLPFKLVPSSSNQFFPISN